MKTNTSAAPGAATRVALRLVLSAGFATALSAQTSPAPAAEKEDGQNPVKLETVNVTAKKPFTDGNMDIVRTIDDAQPYYILGSQLIEESGTVNVEGFLKKQLSMNTLARSNLQVSPNYQGGQSSVNLRGLGSNQTLILIDGRRTSTVSLLGLTTQADVNGIPLGAIDRIEILPASSAAIYGGSAIGGVVNLVLKRNYEGGDLTLSYKNTMDTDAPVRTLDATYGVSLEGGKTHLMVGGQLSKSENPLNQDRSELYPRGLRTFLQNNPSFLRSSASPFLSGTTTNIGSANGTALVLKPAYGGTSLGSNITYVPAGTSSTTAATVLGAGLAANAGNYNFTQANTAYANTGLRSVIGTEPEAKSFIASLRRHMTSRIEAFAEFYLSEVETTSVSSPYGGTFRVAAASPINPFQQEVIVTFPDLTAFEYLSKNVTRRLTTGVLVGLPNDWQAEADYTWTKNVYRYGSGLYDSVSQFAAALNSGVVNPFVDTLANPLSLGSYLGTFGAGQPATLDNFAVRVAGPFASLFGESATLAVGVEHRLEKMEDGYFFRVFPNAPANSLYRTYLAKQQTTLSGYTELKVPLITPRRGLSLVRELELQLAVRSEGYEVDTGTTFTTVGTPTTIVSAQSKYTSTNPTIGLRYKPVESLMIRASYATGFLPPDYAQFLPPTPGGVSILGAAATTTVIDPRRGNQLTTVNYVSGGNPGIEPQSSDNWNVGAVWEPAAVPGLRVNVEWYSIKQENVAVTPTAQQIVDNESLLASRVTRAAVAPGDAFGVGQITNVNFSLLSANQAETAGYDFSVQYRYQPVGWGTFDFAVGGTYIDSFKQQTVLGSPLRDIVGEVANGGPLKFKTNGSVRWTRGPWSASWVTTHFGSYEQYNVGGTTAYVLAQGSAEVPSQTYHDLILGYDWRGRGEGKSVLRSLLADTRLQIGIVNVFDKVPPFDAYYNTSQYYSPFGDARLREYWISVTKRF